MTTFQTPALTLPSLWLLSDARNDASLERALRALPPGSAFVYRHYHLDPKSRRRRFDQLLPLAAAGAHLAILSGSDDEAQAWGALGSYGPPEGVGPKPALLRIAAVHDADEIAHANAAGADAAMLSPVFATRTHPNARPLGPERFHALAAITGISASAAVHDADEIAHANAAGADAAMLSPVFATRTHPNARPLGPERFHALAALAEMPVIALGGMDSARARELGWTRWAAIDGLALGAQESRS